MMNRENMTVVGIKSCSLKSVIQKLSFDITLLVLVSIGLLFEAVFIRDSRSQVIFAYILINLLLHWVYCPKSPGCLRLDNKYHNSKRKQQDVAWGVVFKISKTDTKLTASWKWCNTKVIMSTYFSRVVLFPSHFSCKASQPWLLIKISSSSCPIVLEWTHRETC